MGERWSLESGVCSVRVDRLPSTRNSEFTKADHLAEASLDPWEPTEWGGDSACALWVQCLGFLSGAGS